MTPKLLSKDLPAAVRKVCARHPIVLAYLFGSQASGHADAESDCDIAVLAEASLSKEERFTLRLRLMRELSEEIGCPMEMMDVIMLQDVPVLLQYNVIRRGECLFTRSPGDTHAFLYDVETRYEDALPVLEQETQLTMERILSQTS